MKMTNRSHGNTKSKHRSTYGHKYTKYNKCLNIMVFMYIKQHLSNIGGTIMERLSNSWLS